MKIFSFYVVFATAILPAASTMASPVPNQCGDELIGQPPLTVSPALESQLRSSKHMQELERLSREIGTLIAKANRNDLVRAMSENNVEIARRALGVSEGELLRYELRLAAAVENLLTDFPELSLLMPKNSPALEIGNAVNKLKRQARLQELSSSKARARPKFGEGLAFFPPFPDPDPDPDPGPGDVDPTPPVVNPPSDSVDPHDEASCAWIPFAAGIAACGVGGSAAAAASFGMGSVVYGACAIHIYCDFCEGTVRDSICEP